MSEEKKIATLSFKISPTLSNRIKERADEEKRNVSNFCISVIETYLDKIDEAKKLIDKK